MKLAAVLTVMCVLRVAAALNLIFVARHPIIVEQDARHRLDNVQAHLQQQQHHHQPPAAVATLTPTEHVEEVQVSFAPLGSAVLSTIGVAKGLTIAEHRKVLRREAFMDFNGEAIVHGLGVLLAWKFIQRHNLYFLICNTTYNNKQITPVAFTRRVQCYFQVRFSIVTFVLCWYQ